MHIPFVPLGRPKSASIVDAGPLSVGVPLEGTDTVPGLRALERQAAARRIEGLLGVAAANGFAPGRKYARYRGPLIENLTLDDLKARPRSWAEFFGVGGGVGWRWSWRRRRRRRQRRFTKKNDDNADDADDADADADNKPSSSSSPPPPPPPRYTLPTSVLSLRERAEENVVRFLPNYLRCAAALVVALAALSKTPGPLSLAGVAALAAFAWANAKGLFGGPSFAEALAKQQQAMIEMQQQQQAAAAGVGGSGGSNGGGIGSAFQAAFRAPRPSSQQEQQQTPPRRAAAMILAYGIAAYTRAFAPLARGLFLGFLLSATHACLRVAATERSAWSSAFASSSSSSSDSSSRYIAGVPFWDVVFGAPKSQGQQQQQQQRRRGGGGRGQQQQQRPEPPPLDPRRCLRELAAAARALAAAAAIGVKTVAAAALDSATARVKGLLFQRQQQTARRRG